VAGELEKRQRGREGTGGGARGGVEREQGEESECSEEAKEANGKKEQEVEFHRTQRMEAREIHQREVRAAGVDAPASATVVTGCLRGCVHRSAS
jgi:hypothetical protein